MRQSSNNTPARLLPRIEDDLHRGTADVDGLEIRARCFERSVREFRGGVLDAGRDLDGLLAQLEGGLIVFYRDLIVARP